MNKPNVAIIITCRNKEGTIDECIKSVLAQTYSNIGVIVVDDSSSDESWNIIRSFFKKKDKYEPNSIAGITACGVGFCAIKTESLKGLGYCKNIAVDAGFNASDAFLFVDGDDIIHPTKVEKCVNKWLEDMEAIALVYSNQLIENQLENFDTIMYLPSFSRKMLENADYIEPNYFITKKALFLSGRFEEVILFPDYDMHLRASEKAVFVHIPEVLSTHRVTPLGMTASTNEIDRKKSYEATIKRALTRRGASE